MTTDDWLSGSVGPLSEYLNNDGPLSRAFRWTNDLLNQTGMILTVEDEPIPAYLQLRETEAWLAKAIEGEEVKPAWFNGSSEPVGCCWITILIQDRMKRLWASRQKPEPAEELDLLHRATNELVEHYHAVFEQAVERGDVGVRGMMQ
jgi:hypothetical protein